MLLAASRYRNGRYSPALWAVLVRSMLLTYILPTKLLVSKASQSPSLLLPLSPPAARNCMRLQVLELDHVSEVNQEVAAEVCREGLKGLEMLVLTSTPVTPKALLHFNSEYTLHPTTLHSTLPPPRHCYTSTVSTPYTRPRFK